MLFVGLSGGLLHEWSSVLNSVGRDGNELIAPINDQPINYSITD